MKKLYLAIFLFLLIFCILGLPFTDWGFRSDDWGNIWHSISDNVFTFFTDGKSLDDFHYPSGYEPIKPSFFCGLYRPMSLVYLIPQYWLCTTQAYGYFLITIAIHATCSALLFYIFSLFTNVWLAFLAAAFFGFHPSLHTWIGWISAQTYNIELLVLLIILLLIKSYLDKKWLWAYITAILLFCSNIFLHEQTFFLPFWLMLAIPIYEKCISKKSITSLKTLWHGVMLSLPFLGITIFYMLTRLYYFPLTSNTATLTFQPTWQSFKTRIIERSYDFVTFIVDIVGLTALPRNNALLKISLIMLVLVTLLGLFIKSNKKIIILFLAVSIPLFGWPALLMHNQPRYYYIALPLFIMIVLLLIPFKKGPPFYRKIITLIFMLIIGYNALYLLKDLKNREQLYHPTTTAFEELVKNSLITNRSLCFVGVQQEAHIFGASAQAMWLLRKNNNHPVYMTSTTKDLAPQYQETNPIYVGWDNQAKKFIILEGQ